MLSACLSACFCWRSLRSFGSTRLLTSFACPARSALHALLYWFVLRCSFCFFSSYCLLSLLPACPILISSTVSHSTLPSSLLSHLSSSALLFSSLTSRPIPSPALLFPSLPFPSFHSPATPSSPHRPLPCLVLPSPNLLCPSPSFPYPALPCLSLAVFCPSLPLPSPFPPLHIPCFTLPIS